MRHFANKRQVIHLYSIASQTGNSLNQVIQEFGNYANPLGFINIKEYEQHANIKQETGRDYTRTDKTGSRTGR